MVVVVIFSAVFFTFKRRLDKFWQHQDILYDYKVELTGVGNRSQINADDSTFALLIFRLHKLGIEAHAYAHCISLLLLLI